MRSVEWALHPYYRYPYKKWKLAQRHTQRDDQVKTQGKDGHLYAKEKGLKGSLPKTTHPTCELQGRILSTYVTLLWGSDSTPSLSPGFCKD